MKSLHRCALDSNPDESNELFAFLREPPNLKTSLGTKIGQIWKE